jgi:fucose permease
LCVDGCRTTVVRRIVCRRTRIVESSVKRLLPPLAGLAFISLGLPDGLLGVAWPSIRAFFGLELDALGALLIVTMVGYVTSSFSSGRLLRRMNLGTVLAVSCALTGAGLLGYANAAWWPLMLVLGIVLGLGAGAIDAGLNTYAALHLGPRALNWLHACYGAGAAAGPMIMTAVMHAGHRWQRGYVIVGAAQLALAVAFAITVNWWPTTGGASPGSEATSAAMRSTLREPAAWLGIATFFIYTGVEASVGAWTYTLLTEGRGVAPEPAGFIASLFWGSLTAGRMLAGTAGGAVRVAILLRIALSGVTIGTALVWLDAGLLSTAVGVAVAGCACGPIFPLLVAMTPSRLGSVHAANAVGFQIAAGAVGLSVLPGAVGLAAAHWGIEAIGRLCLLFSVLLAGMSEASMRMSSSRAVRVA